jgi:hypothetical protein
VEPSTDTAGETASPTPRRRVPVWLPVASAAVVVIVIAVVAVLVVSGDDPGYDDAVRQRFLEACTDDGGEPVRSTCECVYEGVEREIPFDRFEEIDDELVAQAAERGAGEPLTLPDDVQAIVERCL